MKPTWESDCGTVKLWRGDCLEVMATWLDGEVDAVVTDPPYGIGKKWQGGFGRGWKKAHDEKIKRNAWDASPMSETECAEIRRISTHQVIWGGNYFSLPASRGWLVWNKPERGFSLSEAELAWTSRDSVIRVIDCNRSEQGRTHPTQKPVKVMRRSIEYIGGNVVADPFMGSGTTGVAAVRLGRKFLGVELDPGYFEIAKRRIQDELAKVAFLEPRPHVQRQLFEASP